MPDAQSEGTGPIDWIEIRKAKIFYKIRVVSTIFDCENFFLSLFFENFWKKYLKIDVPKENFPAYPTCNMNKLKA